MSPAVVRPPISAPPLALKTCPFCAEEIQAAAVVCKHCGRDLANTDTVQRVQIVEAKKAVDSSRQPHQYGLRHLLLVIIVMMVSLVWLLRNDSPRSGEGRPVRPSSANEKPLQRAPATSASSPEFKVVATEDVSMGAVRRLNLRVSLPKHYSRSAVEQVARAVVADTTKSLPVNAISILFYGPGTSTAGIYDVAMVEWAPHGRWGDAGSVRAGDYTTFGYAVSYNAPAPTPTGRSVLTASDRTGLLGVPLPEGAQLIQKTPGDPASGRDAAERYAVFASAVEIAAFFNQAMPAAGWARDGTSTSTALFFRKGKLMIGVLLNSSGGTFTLMGS